MLKRDCPVIHWPPVPKLERKKQGVEIVYLVTVSSSNVNFLWITPLFNWTWRSLTVQTFYYDINQEIVR